VPSKQNLLCGGVSALQVIQRPRARPPAPPTDTPLHTQHYTESPPQVTAPGSPLLSSVPATGSAGSHVGGLSAVLVQQANAPPVSLGPGKRRKRREEEGVERADGGQRTPEFVYSLASTTKYHVLLDQTAGMGRQDRWTNVKRALFRFIDLLPVGSRLNMVAFGDSTREVLPTTTVTELNRDGLFGRIPRRNPRYYFFYKDSLFFLVTSY
jgi:hypothetical protein